MIPQFGHKGFEPHFVPIHGGSTSVWRDSQTLPTDGQMSRNAKRRLSRWLRIEVRAAGDARLRPRHFFWTVLATKSRVENSGERGHREKPSEPVEGNYSASVSIRLTNGGIKVAVALMLPFSELISEPRAVNPTSAQRVARWSSANVKAAFRPSAESARVQPPDNRQILRRDVPAAGARREMRDRRWSSQ